MTALTLAAAYLIAALSIARATRLLTSDAYPPARALRYWWWNQTAGKGGWRRDWNVILVGDTPDRPGCPFCASPYVTAVTVAAAVWADVWDPDLSTLAGWWWVLAVWASLSYVASMIVVRDEPEE